MNGIDPTAMKRLELLADIEISGQKIVDALDNYSRYLALQAALRLAKDPF